MDLNFSTLRSQNARGIAAISRMLTYPWDIRLISANKGNLGVFSANKENLGFRQIRSGFRETRDWAARGGRKPGFSVLKTARNQAFPPLLVIKIPKFFAPAAQQ